MNENINQNTHVAQPMIVHAGEGPVLEAFGDTIQVKLSGEHTNNALAVELGSTPPGEDRRPIGTATRTSCS